MASTNDLIPEAQMIYVRTQSYDDKRLLEPERIVIPPASINFDSGTPAFHVTDIPQFDHVNESCGNPVFMKRIRSLQMLDLRHNMLSWKYEHRKQAQPILPFLLLGPHIVAQDPAFVQASGVTFMVAVRSGFTARKLPKYLDPAFFPSAAGLETATVDLDGPYDLAMNVRRIIKSMNDHLEKSCVHRVITSIDDIKAKILVFCESGNERSTVLLCAYLMVVFGVDMMTAIQITQSQRFSIDVKDDMKNMLLNFESVLVAERQVAEAKRLQEQAKPNMSKTNSQPPALNKSSKRSIDRAYESDEEMEGTIEWSGPDHGNNRLGVAPFADAAT